VTDDTLFFTSQDNIIWIQISGNKLSIDKDIFIGLCYVIPDNSIRQSTIDDNIFDRLINTVTYVENCPNDDYYYLIIWRVQCPDVFTPRFCYS
jgi:hypothetical protein